MHRLVHMRPRSLRGGCSHHWQGIVQQLTPSPDRCPSMGERDSKRINESSQRPETARTGASNVEMLRASLRGGHQVPRTHVNILLRAILPMDFYLFNSLALWRVFSFRLASTFGSLKYNRSAFQLSRVNRHTQVVGSCHQHPSSIGMSSDL